MDVAATFYCNISCDNCRPPGGVSLDYATHQTSSTLTKSRMSTSMIGSSSCSVSITICYMIIDICCRIAQYVCSLANGSL